MPKPCSKRGPFGVAVRAGHEAFHPGVRLQPRLPGRAILKDRRRHPYHLFAARIGLEPLPGQRRRSRGGGNLVREVHTGRRHRGGAEHDRGRAVLSRSLASAAGADSFPERAGNLSSSSRNRYRTARLARSLGEFAPTIPIDTPLRNPRSSHLLPSRYCRASSGQARIIGWSRRSKGNTSPVCRWCGTSPGSCWS